MQGGPHLHTIAGIAIALRFAQGKPFRDYAKQVVVNAQVLAEGLSLTGMIPVNGLILQRLKNWRKRQNLK